MNETDTRDRSCGRKRRHATYREAVKAVRRLAVSNIVTAYPCPFCHGWHIGHAPYYVRKEIQRLKLLFAERLPKDITWFGSVKFDLQPTMTAIDFFSSRLRSNQSGHKR